MVRSVRSGAGARAAALLLPLAIAWPPSARGETLSYRVEVPEGQSVTYFLELEVRHAGTLSVHAEWPESRSVSLRLVPPTQSWAALHRSGPSPQILETNVGGDELGTWTLRIHSLAARGGGSGAVIVELPDESPREDPAKATEPEPPPEPEPWMLPRVVRPGTPAEWRPFLEATEQFRERILGDPAVAPEDVCQWQARLMRYLADQRERLLADGRRPAESTGKLLDRIARAVRSVEEMRTSDDPLLAGPPPREAHLREAWLQLRTTKVDPVEAELDGVLGMVQRDFASELEDQDWPVRFVSCLTACQRFFDQRAQVGEERAGNRDLALAQWPRILLAGEALSALARLAPAARAGDTAPRPASGP